MPHNQREQAAQRIHNPLDVGPVAVPDHLAGEVLATLMLGLAQRVRRDGAQLGPATRRLLHDLNEATARHASGCAIATEIAAHLAMRETMTTAEAAERLHCTQANVRALAARGRLPGRRTGRVWLLDPRAVEAYARRNR